MAGPFQRLPARGNSRTCSGIRAGHLTNSGSASATRFLRLLLRGTFEDYLKPEFSVRLTRSITGVIRRAGRLPISGSIEVAQPHSKFGSMNENPTVNGIVTRMRHSCSHSRDFHDKMLVRCRRDDLGFVADMHMRPRIFEVGGVNAGLAHKSHQFRAAFEGQEKGHGT